MPAENPMLGKSLGKMIADLTDLIVSMNDTAKKEALRKQHRKLTRKLQDLIDKTVPTDTGEYARAVAAIEEGNRAIRKAISRTSQADEAIAKIAKAVTALGKLLTVLAV